MSNFLVNLIKRSNFIKDIIRRNRILYKIYHRYWRPNNTPISLATNFSPFTISQCQTEQTRINLLVPSINSEHVFGGIATALFLFNKLIEQLPETYHFRIILTDVVPNQQALARFSGYKLIEPLTSCDARFQITAFTQRSSQTLVVSKQDIFIATAWWTAYIAQSIIKQQALVYQQKLKSLIYLIQDFEPCFYNWSSEYLLADATYQSTVPTIAVFNTSLLQDFFCKKGYEFAKQFSFEPKLHPGLKQHLIENHPVTKKKQILIYGRPCVSRNAFSLIIEALKLWIKLYQEEAVKWQIISIGEKHPDINLDNGITLYSVGKLEIAEYARLLSESKVGISLMVSPHPSYPPLEMAHFGLQVLTNVFANKDLSQLHSNITSVVDCSPEHLADSLQQLCVQADLRADKGQSHMPDYLTDNEQFPFIGEIIQSTE